MYGVVPMIQTKRLGESMIGSVVWANSSDTFIDIYDEEKKKKVHWMSEAGCLEFYLLSSESPKEVSKKLSQLTGKQ